MIEIIKHKKISSIKEKWQKLALKSDSTVPMMQFDFIEMFTSDIISKIRSLIKKAPSYIEVIDNNETVLIFPCLEEGEALVSLYTLDYFDCVFDNSISREQLLNYLNEISNKECKKIIIKRLKDDGATYKKLKDLVNFEPYNECVKINIDGDIDAEFGHGFLDSVFYPNHNLIKK